MKWPWDTNRPRPIFLCHGCFDLLHVGHLAHLLEVRRLANRVNGLVYVSVTADEFVNKGPGRPIMPAEERQQILQNLKCVDAAVISGGPTAELMIHCLRPRWYCKGADYRGKVTWPPSVSDDIALTREIEAVVSHGGNILYTAEPARHSTDYLQRYLNANRA